MIYSIAGIAPNQPQATSSSTFFTALMTRLPGYIKLTPSASPYYPSCTPTTSQDFMPATMMSYNIEEASRIAADKGIDLKDIGLAEARRIMSEEHKALGYRPPHGSLASAAQAAASKHPNPGSNGLHIDEGILRKAALEDAARIAAQRPQPGSPEMNSSTSGINLDAIGIEEARKLMSAEHKALGYRPPPGSLAADAQAAASKHPKGLEGVPKPPRELLAQEALKDAARIASQRNGSNSSGSPPESPEHSAKDVKSLPAETRAILDEHGSDPMTKDVAAEIVSEEHTRIGHRPEAGSVAAHAQSVADKNENDDGNRVLFAGSDLSPVAKAILKDHSDEVMSKEVASELVSEAHRRLGHLPESGTIAPTAQSIADKNGRDGAGRVLEA
ncbi:SMP domain-containing protein [Pleurotus pulmonarius]